MRGKLLGQVLFPVPWFVPDSAEPASKFIPSNRFPVFIVPLRF